MTSNGDGRSPSRAQAGPELDTAPVDWGAVTQSLIGAAIAEERRFTRAVMAEVVAEMRATTNDDLERAVRFADGRARRPQTLAEVRLAFASDRTQALELPNPLSKRAGLN